MQLTAPRSLILNALLFQAGWFACVFGATHPWLLALALACLAAHFVWVASWRAEGRLVASVALFGSALDTFLLNLGVFDFAGDSRLLPPWLALLWALFATSLNHSLAWSARPWWLGSLLGAIAGPLSYLGGAKLAGVGLPLGLWPTLLLLAAIWAGVMVVVHGFAGMYRARAAQFG
ncbi:DUF2878 domain-containing protein [Aquipseudomonas alcaligenes]|uniref:DUF2878 domain-containing protein n=1 Tax=Aquipseudomonas alcaligenes TaxID=43263 RepID=A0A2V4L9D2_AQUAC|nr:DUF2878 domain-containing protein [Pseudomonas alcaligenes]PYC28358.1 DUF2878 domain-containing protein [Pseudomonas alcaligenes]